MYKRMRIEKALESHITFIWRKGLFKGSSKKKSCEGYKQLCLVGSDVETYC